MLSVIVPTYNERENVEPLILRLEEALLPYLEFEIIFVDDKSEDGTFEFLNELSSLHPIRVFRKTGKKGKAYSLIQGFLSAKYDILAILDSDLQYDPGEIYEMLKRLKDYDIVVANRKVNKTGKLRTFLSKTFKNVFSNLFFDINADVQSGLKVFRREVIETISYRAKSAWTFDLEFLKRAKEAGFTIGSHDIEFKKRNAGKSKLNVGKVSVELFLNALLLKLRRIEPVYFKPKASDTNIGAGVAYGGKRYITHTILKSDISALENFVAWQKLFVFFLFGVVSYGLFKNVLFTLGIFVGVLSVVYFVDVIFNFFLILRSLHHESAISVTDEEIDALVESDLPIYTILCPLYKEAEILPNFLGAIDKLDWPKDKLDTILLLEEDDRESIELCEAGNLPSYVSTLVVPDSLPKTKPKACNWGLWHARGELLVVYDAEDVPDPKQLKKAYIAFSKVPRDVMCLQAKLNYHNAHQNILTRLFTAEYSLWFDVVLMGLQSIKTNIPLGGTSNHFPVDELKKLEGWDPFNVTEDADLGVRLFKAGYKTAVIDSTTYEEANSRVGNWIRQRSRWLKGYMQTYLVHTRNPLKFYREYGLHAFVFQLLLGGKIAFMFINPILWLVTLLYFPLFSIMGETVNKLYPAPVFYMAIISLVFGNFMYMYFFMIGCAKREQWSLVKYVFLIPLYWLLGSVAALVGLHQLIFKPHFWEKTQHGLNIKQTELSGTLSIWQNIKAVFGSQFEGVYSFLSLPRLKNNIPGLPKISGYLAGSGSFLVISTVFANFLNFIYNAYLTRAVSLESYALISLIGSFTFLTTILFVSLSRTVTHKTAFFLGKHKEVISEFWRQTRKKVFLLSCGVALVWIILSPFFSVYFRENSILPFILFSPVWLVGAVAAVDEGFIFGSHKYQAVGILLVVEAISRLMFTWFLVEMGFGRFVYVAIPISLVIAFCAGWIYASRLGKAKHKRIEDHLLFPSKFFITSILTKFWIVAFISLDLILAKHYLPNEEAGRYALLSIAAKSIFFIGSLFSQFITPIVSKEEGEGQKSKSTFNKIFALSSIGACGAYIAIGLFGHISAPILFGDKAHVIAQFLPLFGFAILLFTISTSLMLFHQTRKLNLFPAVGLALALFEIFMISIFHSNISQIVNGMFIVSISGFVVLLLMHIFEERVRVVSRNLEDLVLLFAPNKNKKALIYPNLRILIMNWRDLKHKWAGGAEIYAHEIAKNLVKQGHQVTIFCGNDGHNLRFEKIDGVNIIRRGGFYTVYIWAFLYYIFRFRKKFDLVIDCENGIPFFTPLYSNLPIIVLVHHVHQEVFRTQLAFPFNKIAQVLEGFLMPVAYRNKKLVTVSNSSKVDLEKLGFVNSIEVINPGVDNVNVNKYAKTQYPQLLYMGRLKPYKSIDTLIYSMIKIASVYPKARLIIAGEGESEDFLKRLVEKLGLVSSVEFMGRVDDELKWKLLSESWIFVQPSMLEGWGISVVEASSCSTAVIASSVAGLRDSVVHNYNGFLVEWGNVDSFSSSILSLISNEELRKRLERQGTLWASQFSWERSSTAFYNLILREVNSAKSPKFTENVALGGEKI